MCNQKEGWSMRESGGQGGKAVIISVQHLATKLQTPFPESRSQASNSEIVYIYKISKSVSGNISLLSQVTVDWQITDLSFFIAC